MRAGGFFSGCSQRPALRRWHIRGCFAKLLIWTSVCPSILTTLLSAHLFRDGGGNGSIPASAQTKVAPSMRQENVYPEAECLLREFARIDVCPWKWTKVQNCLSNLSKNRIRKANEVYWRPKTESAGSDWKVHQQLNYFNKKDRKNRSISSVRSASLLRVHSLSPAQARPFYRSMHQHVSRRGVRVEMNRLM